MGYHSILTGDIQAGHNVAVLGLGVLGYTSSIFSKISGANVFALTNQQQHKKLVESNGILYLPKTEESVNTIQKNTHQVGVDVVINTSNSWQDWKLALQLVNKGGTIVNVGFPGRGQGAPDFNPLDPKYVYLKNVTIKYLTAMNVKGAEPELQRFNRERNLQYILDQIASGNINTHEIISAEIDYTELQTQYELYASHTQNLFSTLVKW